MSCKLCSEPLSYANFSRLSRACTHCHRHYEQMRAGFRGYRPEPKKKDNLWDNSSAYEEWLQVAPPIEQVRLFAKEEYAKQRCDIRDMRGDVGLPKFEPLESQVYNAWIEEGVKVDKMAEVLGLSTTQIRHIMSVVRMKLRKQMAYFQEVQKLEADAEDIKKRKGL